MRVVLNLMFSPGVSDRAAKLQPAKIHQRLDPFSPLHHQCTA